MLTIWTGIIDYVAWLATSREASGITAQVAICVIQSSNNIGFYGQPVFIGDNHLATIDKTGFYGYFTGCLAALLELPTILFVFVLGSCRICVLA